MFLCFVRISLRLGTDIPKIYSTWIFFLFGFDFLRMIRSHGKSSPLKTHHLGNVFVIFSNYLTSNFLRGGTGRSQGHREGCLDAAICARV